MSNTHKEDKTNNNPYNNVILAKNLRTLRGLFEYSQQEIADLLQISKISYRSMETGKTHITFETLYTLSVFYGIQLDYILSFDISAQLIDLLKIKTDEDDLFIFLDSYFNLSTSEKEEIKIDIKKLLEYERKFNNKAQL